tara:strand:+ start:121409 stop:122281 length:873 start_codon:yes stop_codon:yes gene_type:complete
MTGFSSIEKSKSGYDWIWEIKSVNSRSLDLRLRLGSGVERYEQELRQKISKYIRRGNISVTLRVTSQQREEKITVNRDLLNSLIDLWQDYSSENKVDPPRFDGLLRVRGVVDLAETKEEMIENTPLDRAIINSFDSALEGLLDSRKSEGAKIETILLTQIDEINTLVKRAVDCSLTVLEKTRSSLKKKVDSLMEDKKLFDEDRLAQEIVILATKSDIREELDRLAAHIQAAKIEITKGGVVGRKLDFLSQEFNREANTLCAKASDQQLNEIGLSMKVVIDQFREQVQNLE